MTKNRSLRLPELVALVLGAVGLAGCGGGAETGRPDQLVVDLRPPVLPPEIPIPPAPIPPVPLPEIPDVPADDVENALAEARALTEVTVNPAVPQAPETYAGLYVGGDRGLLFRRAADGRWNRIDALVGTVIEGMAYVEPKHALYIVTRDVVGCRLGRLFLAPDAAPRFEWLSGGLDGTVLGSENLTGLTFDTRTQTLYASDNALQGVFRFATLDSGAATPVAVGLGVVDLQDLAFDAINDRLLLLDRQARAVVNFDHHRLVLQDAIPLGFADMRALAWERAGTRLVVDRDTAALIRFDEAGAVVP